MVKNGSKVSKGTKYYNLALPQELFEDIQQIADARQTTVVEIIRRSLKLGVLAFHLQENPDTEFIIRQGDTERGLLLL